MIRDIPTATDFEITGISLLNLAWDTVSSLYLDRENSKITEWDDGGQVLEEFWQSAHQHLSNALVLTQQGIEFFVKARIARVSPFLLLDRNPKDWPKGCSENDTPFADFRTLDAQDLIRVHDTVAQQRLNTSFCRRVDGLRRARNSVMHSLDKRLRHSPSDLWISILDASHHLLGPQLWIGTRRKYLEGSPSSLVFSDDTPAWQLSWECQHLLQILTPSQVSEFLGADLKSRWYICSGCEIGAPDYFETPPRTAQLRPKGPNATDIFCFVCGITSTVSRRACSDPDCKGNVIDPSENVCLTCHRDQTPSW